MKHLTWDFHGYDDLKLDLGRDILQSDWNLTIYNQLCSAAGIDKFNIFCSESALDILEENAGFDRNSMSLFGKRIRVLLFNTPKIYVTKHELDDFSLLEHDNHGSVTIKNYPN